MGKKLQKKFNDILLQRRNEFGDWQDKGLVDFVVKELISGNFQTSAEKIRVALEADRHFASCIDYEEPVEEVKSITQDEFKTAILAWREKNQVKII